MSLSNLLRVALSGCAWLVAGATPGWAADTSLSQQAPPTVALGLDEARLDPAALERAALEALRSSAQALSGDRQVQVEITDLRAWPDSIAAIELDGVGRVRVERGGWIPLRFQSGYDLKEGHVFGLRVEPISSATRTSAFSSAIEAGMGERVNDQVASRILAEFPDQPLEIVFVDLQPTSDSSSHVAFRGTGLVDFADEGSAPVSFSAILDRASGLVVALDYSFEIAGAHGEAAMVETIAAMR